MRAIYTSIIALMASSLLMVIGNGLLGTLLPLRGRLNGFDATELGFLGSAYFGGMLLGAIGASRAIKAIGHVRVIAACMVLASCSTLIFALSPNIWLWMGMRFVYGFAFAGLYAAMEAWLQGKATNEIRGRVLAVYSVVQYAGWGIGSQMIRLGDLASFELFSIAAVALSLAILPLVIADTDQPELPKSGALRLMEILKDSPIGFVGVLVCGVVSGPFWSLAPPYGSEMGLTPGQIGTLMTMMTAGAALFQIPVGRISDRSDRRKVLLTICFVAMVLEIGLAFAPKGMVSYVGLLTISAILGGLITTKYYVIAAHANDRAPKADAVRISAALLLLFCIGAFIGPTSAAYMMKLFGPGALFLHNGIAHMLLAGYVVYRMAIRPPPTRPADGDALTYRPAP